MKPIIDYEPGEKIKHSEFGIGRIVEIKGTEMPLKWIVDFAIHGRKTLLPSSEHLLEIDSINTSLTYKDIKDAVREVLEEELCISEVEMGDRWTGGKMILVPNRKDLQPKEIPLDGFFHKIVMIRDRLRVLEQKINAHEMFTDEDKVEFHQYITRIYGSLTTFNVLFKNRDDWFVGQKGE
jgi:hypothetical protein